MANFATETERRPWLPLPPWARGTLVTLSSIAVTMLGLLFVTFLIGRVMPIDPVPVSYTHLTPADDTT
jgi:peptide/nickel transport system permease protein